MEKHFLSPEEPARYDKRWLYMASGIGFLIGIVMANTVGRKTVDSIGLFGDYFLMQMETVTMEASSVLSYVLEKRLLFLVLVVISAVMNNGNVIIYILAGWIGWSTGILLSAAALHQGIKGIVLCFAGLFPHYLIYVPVGIGFMVRSCLFSRRLHGREQRHMYSPRKEVTRYLCWVLAVVAAFGIGMLLESYLNTKILQKIYKIFNNI